MEENFKVIVRLEGLKNDGMPLNFTVVRVEQFYAYILQTLQSYLPGDDHVRDFYVNLIHKPFVRGFLAQQSKKVIHESRNLDYDCVKKQNKNKHSSLVRVWEEVAVANSRDCDSNEVKSHMEFVRHNQVFWVQIFNNHEDSRTYVDEKSQKNANLHQLFAHV